MAFTILDLSNWQKGIKLASLHGVDAFIYRAAIGTSKWDDCLKDFMSQNSKPWGLYTASYSKNVAEAIAEADYICDIADSYGIKPNIFYDWEYFSANYLKNTFGITATPVMVQDMTTAFCKRVAERGFKPGVYFNYDFLMNWYKPAYFEQHKEYLRWYARPGKSQPDYDCDIWQYAANAGTEFGYAGDVDKNILMKDVAVVEPVSTYPVRMAIGYISAGDANTIIQLVEDKGVFDNEYDEGWVYTGVLSAGDQISIIKKVKELSDKIEIHEYVPVIITAEAGEISPEEKLEGIVDKLDEEIEKPGTEEISADTEPPDNWLIKLIKFILSLFRKGE